MASIKQRAGALANVQDAKELKKVLDAIKTDIDALATALDTLATKMNSDTGVNDTDYATGNAAAVTLQD